MKSRTPSAYRPRRTRTGRKGMVLIVLVGCTLFLIGGVLLVRTHTLGITSTKPIDPKAYTNVSVIGKAAVVYDLTDGKTLYEKNADSSLPLASVTKLLTVYAASGVLRPDSVVTITPLALAQRGDEADGIFYKGESFRFDEITRLTLAASSNIGAEAIAEAADAGAHTDTATLLAEAAKEIGLAHTRALNATGLDKSASVSGSYGSAHDVAVLAGELLKKNPQAAPATTQPDVTITSREGVHHRFDNTNADVTTYPNLLLSKTGYTDLAGGNLVIVVDVGMHHPVVIVVLGSTVDGRFTDVSKLLTATRAYFSGAH